jgi:uncharacterized protein (TIGR03066 family)
MRTALAILATFAASAVTADAAPVPKPKPKTDADRIVGTWKMVKRGGEPARFKAVFTADGKLTLHYLRPDGTELFKETGKYKVADGKLEYTLAQENAPARTDTDTIKKLTDDELVLVDADGVQEEFKRVGEEKKDDM